MPEIISRFNFGLFHCGGSGLLRSECIQDLALFRLFRLLCMLDVIFYLLVPPRGYCFVINRFTESFPSTHPTTR